MDYVMNAEGRMVQVFGDLTISERIENLRNLIAQLKNETPVDTAKIARCEANLALLQKN